MYVDTKKKERITQLKSLDDKDDRNAVYRARNEIRRPVQGDNAAGIPVFDEHSVGFNFRPQPGTNVHDGHSFVHIKSDG